MDHKELCELIANLCIAVSIAGALYALYLLAMR